MAFEDGSGKNPDAQKQSIEIIRSPAVKYNDEQFIGRDHNEAWRVFEKKYPEIFPKLNELEKMKAEGFVTTASRFVSREEALEIARINDQLVGESDFTRLGMLTSDDLKKEE